MKINVLQNRIIYKKNVMEEVVGMEVCNDDVLMFKKPDEGKLLTSSVNIKD